MVASCSTLVAVREIKNNTGFFIAQTDRSIYYGESFLEAFGRALVKTAGTTERLLAIIPPSMSLKKNKPTEGNDAD